MKITEQQLRKMIRQTIKEHRDPASINHIETLMKGIKDNIEAYSQSDNNASSKKAWDLSVELEKACGVLYKADAWNKGGSGSGAASSHSKVGGILNKLANLQSKYLTGEGTNIKSRKS